MATWVVTLDGGEAQPERSGPVTAEAATAEDAKALAEQQNPGLSATNAEKE